MTRNFSPQLIPQLKVIIPMLELLSPVEVYTSENVKLEEPLYPNLIKSFESTITFHPLEEIIENVIQAKTGKLKICVLGEEDVGWKTVLSCKRK